MNTRPKLTSRADQPYVAIPIEVTSREWGRADALFDELFAWLSRRGVEPAGPPFYRYWVVGDADAKFGLEAGVPVAHPVAGDGRVFADLIPGGAYASLRHETDPDRLAESHAALRQWAAGEGIGLDREVGAREVWGGLFEFHLGGPVRQFEPRRGSMEIAYRVTEGDS